MRFRRWLESGEIALDAGLDLFWVTIASAALVTIASAVGITIHGMARYDAFDAVQSMVSTQASQTQAARATIYPPNTIADASFGAVSVANCSGAPAWCLEKVIYQRSTDGDHYIGYATLTGTGNQQEVATFTTTGFVGGVAQNVVIIGRTRIATVDSVLYASVPVTSISTDVRNPAAAVVAAYLTDVGAAPVARTINWGPNLAIGSNNLELVKWNIAGISTTTGMAIGTLPAKNVTIVAGFATPTPIPGFNPALTTASLTYDWPSAVTGVGGAKSGPTSFQVQLTNYHDAFFAEDSSCANPNPAYVPGTSPTYIPGTDFGTAGPWVYPNPNPTSPPNQNSGPATFNAAPTTAGLCNIDVYTTYTPRSGVILPTEPQPFQEPVQVMGWLTLKYGANSATSQTAALSIPAASISKGSVFTIDNSKTDDQTAVTPSVAYSAGCAGYFTEANGAQSGGGSSSGTASGSFNITVATLPAAATACTVSVTDQYSEPYVSVVFNLPAGTGPLVTLSQVEFNGADLAYDPRMGPQIDVAMFINSLLGGGTASAAGTTCGYAQLYMYNTAGASVLDANGADGFNATDANGCLAAGPVKLWATESSYTGSFGESNVACSAYVSASSLSWGVGASSSLSPIATTAGCAFPVFSSDRPVGSGSKNVNVIVDAEPTCYNDVTTCTIVTQTEGPIGGGLCIAHAPDVCDGYTTTLNTYDPTTQTWSKSAPTKFIDCTGPGSFGGSCQAGAPSYTPTGTSGDYYYFNGVNDSILADEWVVNSCPPAWIFTQGFVHGSNC